MHWIFSKMFDEIEPFFLLFVFTANCTKTLIEPHTCRYQYNWEYVLNSSGTNDIWYKFYYWSNYCKLTLLIILWNLLYFFIKISDFSNLKIHKERFPNTLITTSHSIYFVGPTWVCWRIMYIFPNWVCALDRPLEQIV